MTAATVPPYLAPGWVTKYQRMFQNYEALEHLNCAQIFGGPTPCVLCEQTLIFQVCCMCNQNKLSTSILSN